MPIIDENWQTTRSSLREKSEFLFSNDLFSDVKFVVQGANGGSIRQVIPAHKFVLSINSPVLFSMFNSQLAESSESIELPECDYKSVMELLRYIYRNEVKLNGSYVMQVLYLAKKYTVPSLADRCIEFLHDILDPSPFVQKYEEKQPGGFWKVIDSRSLTEEGIQSDGFATIETSLVMRETLTIEEMEMSKALDLWAVRECARQGLPVKGETKGKILAAQIATRTRYSSMLDKLFNNELFSDVKFLVGRANHKSKQLVIPAHKFVLAISSPVFYSMFYGMLAETGDSIKLPDCDFKSLREFFRYIYNNKVNLNGKNVMQVLYLAKKYMVPSLAEQCTEFLQDNLDLSNVFIILPSAEKYDEKHLADRCWKLIDQHTGEAVKLHEFATIERSFLQAIVERETITIEEIELFKAVDLWATKNCERQGLAANGEFKRKILGEQIVKGIRYPTMKQVHFAREVFDSQILTPEERIDIYKCLNSVSRSSMGFSESKRSGFQQCST